MEFVGIDWATRRAAWCAVDSAGRRLGEGAVPAEEDGLLQLVAARGLEVTAAVEMMSGAAWIAETLRGVGWTVRVAAARRVATRRVRECVRHSLASSLLLCGIVPPDAGES